MANEPITALLPKSGGHQFVIYGDSCSGIPNTLHERTFAEVNAFMKGRVGLRTSYRCLKSSWRHPKSAIRFVPPNGGVGAVSCLSASQLISRASRLL